jgi:hypothetical protein
MSRDERIAARLVAAIQALMPAWCTISIDAGWLRIAIDGKTEVSVGLVADERASDRMRSWRSTS